MKNKTDFLLEKWKIVKKTCTVLFKVPCYESYRMHGTVLYIPGTICSNVLFRNFLEIFYKHILKHCNILLTFSNENLLH